MVNTLLGKKLINLTVIQIPNTDNEVALWAVLFNSEDYDITQNSNLENSDNVHNMRISELEQELTATREHLQTTIEELETTNEELQSTNEEMQSANEELQSANEELETANEELQSTNEELSTINQELQIKSTELTILNADLENILAALSIPIVVLDRNLRITRVSSAVSGLLDIKYNDVGQNVLNFTGRLGANDLQDKIIQVISEGVIQQVSVKSGNKSYWLTITPYYADKRMIEGVLLVFKEYYATRRAKNTL
jgi:two-component system CheB/CheR fusion protein